ncbi:glycosyltransferase family 4 protein [Sphingobium limneticum]|uniref:glycosyltransferase family 4 protein n=1 Tax=Sphingobium limneticum TaxID=1007511 RepID=UPI00123E15AD|nr:glycosyltransferase family 4 protein [Sphingobium limneticum]KAA9013038.1 glycosyltransferase family 4 protein [Sphingobium limneticum]
MRLGYISIASPFDRASWSGVPWYSYNEVKKRFPDTHVIDTPRLDKLVTRLAPLARAGILVSREPILARAFSTYVDKQLEKIRPDAIVAIGAAHKLAYINKKWPMVYVADALFDTIINYYDQYRGLNERTRRVGNIMQRELVDRCDILMMTSQWAADAAAADYGIAAERLLPTPYGANLESDPGFKPPSPGGVLRLLFAGYAWERKGGPLALEIWKAVRARLPDAELHIIGCRPPAATGLEGVHIHGLLRKSVPDEYARFVQLFAASSFFLMPSRQEAFGLVFGETAAFGRPAVAMATGGVPTVVQDGRTGLLMQPDASAATYADRILSVWSDPAGYSSLCRAARRDFEQRLNWDAWGQRLEIALEQVTRSSGVEQW